VQAELLNMVCYHVQGCDLTVSLAAQAGQLEVNVMMPVIAHNLFEVLHIFPPAIRTFADAGVRPLEANREKAEGWLAHNAVLATALNPVVGYLAAADIAKQALAEGRTIKEVVLARGLMSEAEADDVLDPRPMTEGGIQGGKQATK
jgi:fumarate hydratase, class II